MRSAERLTELLESTEAQVVSLIQQRDEALKKAERIEQYCLERIRDYNNIHGRAQLLERLVEKLHSIMGKTIQELKDAGG